MVLAAGDVTEFLSIDLTTIIATLLNTLILFLVLKHFLFDKVNKVCLNNLHKCCEETPAALLMDSRPGCFI